MKQDAAPATILVVDDEASLLRLLSRVLGRQGYTVLTAANGNQAIDLFDEHRDVIDGVILDVVIPPNGIAEVLDHMLSLRGDLAVILSSGDFPDSEISARVKAHDGAFLHKPYLPKVLLEQVEAVLEVKRRSGSEAENATDEPVRPHLGSETPGPNSGLGGNEA